MSLAHAFRFVAALRAEERLRDRAVRCTGLEEIAALARDDGFDVSDGEHRAAHRQDWALRALAAGVAKGGAAEGKRASSSRASAGQLRPSS